MKTIKTRALLRVRCYECYDCQHNAAGVIAIAIIINVNNEILMAFMPLERTLFRPDLFWCAQKFQPDFAS